MNEQSKYCKMNEFTIDRRKLIKLGLSASAFAFLPLGCLPLSDDRKAIFLQKISDSKLPIHPDRRGKLTDLEFKTLASLCKYVNKIWELTPDLDIYLKMLKADLDLKTGEEPSYLTEYKNALELIDAVVNNNDDEDKGWATLLFSEFEDAEFEDTQLGRARRLVFSEMIAHFVPISEGFKTFGLWNYPGYFGGPYVSPKSYRKANVG